MTLTTQIGTATLGERIEQEVGAALQYHGLTQEDLVPTGLDAWYAQRALGATTEERHLATGATFFANMYEQEVTPDKSNILELLSVASQGTDDVKVFDYRVRCVMSAPSELNVPEIVRDAYAVLIHRRREAGKDTAAYETAQQEFCTLHDLNNSPVFHEIAWTMYQASDLSVLAQAEHGSYSDFQRRIGSIARTQGPVAQTDMRGFILDACSDYIAANAEFIRAGNDVETREANIINGYKLARRIDKEFKLPEGVGIKGVFNLAAGSIVYSVAVA